MTRFHWYAVVAGVLSLAVQAIAILLLEQGVWGVPPLGLHVVMMVAAVVLVVRATRKPQERR